MAGIYFAWSAVWVVSPDWLCRKLELCDAVRRLGEAALPGGGECGPYPDSSSYTLAFALQMRKSHGKFSVRVTEGNSAEPPNATCFVDLAIAADGVYWPAGPYRTWLLR